MRKFGFGLVLSSMILASCQDSDTDPQTIVISTDSETLSERIKLDGSGVVSLINPDAAGRILETSSELPIVLISQVEAPEYQGVKLRATHVDINGDYAYVGYNMEGETYLGAVEIFDISDVYKPKIVSQALFTDAEVSSLEYANGTLQLAMAVDVDGDFGVDSPANLVRVAVAAGKFTSGFSFTSLPGFVANDVTEVGNSTAVTTGNPGVLGLVDLAGNVAQEVEVEDLRSVAYGNDRLAVLSGTEGAIVYNPSNLAQLLKISLGSATPEAKRTIAIADNNLFVSEGSDGAGIYSLSSGQLVSKLPIPINPEGTDPGDIVTNAVSVDNSLLFMANGAAGISVSDVQNTSDIKSLGILDLDGSSNFVRNEENFIFVATGAGGLQILKINKPVTDPTEELCKDLPAYTGNSNLNVNSNEKMAYSGSASLKNVNVGGELLYCGSLAIESSLNVNSNGIMQVVGSFAFGQYKKNTTINVNSDSYLKLSGSTVIYGDLRLNSGATLEFVGEGNTITVYGDVTINSGAKIVGNYTDTEGKLK
ncbi:hypothetical protein J0A68_21145 [Algoriphagus sp. H41]|uniref:LVIVD repeat-containing protein n=1 Tax=Algoriphagus oliviformis TaxID=2811231 RepID=A0ABS3CAB4_9BACT|nr:hypothetical protein [Algoriphagus oliviformis]MBN7813476.1 hypothetical protein [Algoriphagus oliviformis]